MKEGASLVSKRFCFRQLALCICALGALNTIGSLAAQAPVPSQDLIIAIRGKSFSGVAIADPRTMKVIAHVPINGGDPHEIAVSTDGRFAFVTNTNYGKAEPDALVSPPADPVDFVSVIDVSKQKEVRRIQTGPNSLPHGIFVAGNKLFFATEGYQTLNRYDLTTEEVDAVFGVGQVGTHELVATRNAEDILASSLITDSVVVIEPWDHRDRGHPEPHAGGHPWMTTVIHVGDEPEGIAISPDDKEVWVLNRGLSTGEGTVSVIDVSKRQVSQTLDLRAKGPVRLQFTPDGKRVVICDRSGDIMVFDAVTKKEIKRIHFASKGPHSSPDLDGVAIAGDNSQAYVTVHGENCVSDNNCVVGVVDMKSLELIGTIPLPGPPEGIASVGGKYGDNNKLR